MRNPLASRWQIGLFLALALISRAVLHAADPTIVTAAQQNDAAAVRAQISRRVNVNQPAGDGSTALLWAVYNSNIEMTRALLAAGATGDAANRYGVTPLLQASRTGDASIMAALLKAGASANRAHVDAETPLMAAARTGKVEAVRLLVEAGADVN